MPSRAVLADLPQYEEETMPQYEIITRATGRRPDDNPLGMWAAMARRGDLRDEVVDRTVVASLDEARDIARTTMDRVLRSQPPVRNEYEWSRPMPPEGGTIGPLPDGTVIEVRPA
jgi:hypothetical protein